MKASTARLVQGLGMQRLNDLPHQSIVATAFDEHVCLFDHSYLLVGSRASARAGLVTDLPRRSVWPSPRGGMSYRK
jgi:hypothetical protein